MAQSLISELAKAREAIFVDIDLTRIEQIRQWGRDNHTPEEWLMIFSKHVGRLHERVLELHDSLRCAEYGNTVQLQRQREQIIKCAAILVAWEEQIRTLHIEVEEPKDEVF